MAAQSPFFNINETNPNYLISIFGKDEQGTVIGTSENPYGGILSPIPEDFTIETVSTWHSLLDGILKTIAHTFIGGTNVGAGLIGAGSALTGAFGYSLSNQALTQLIWESTSPVNFNIPLKFDAIKDAYAEVTQPIEQLLKLTLPSQGSLVDPSTTGSSVVNSLVPLSSPGPSFSANSKYDVNIAIGNMFIFSKVIITAVSATFHTLSVAEGDFISADVNLSVTTSRILTKKDIGDAFKNRGSFRGARASLPSAPAISPTLG